MNEKHQNFLGFSEIPSGVPRLECFDALFDEEPATEFLVPSKMTKQSVSRRVFRPGFRTHNIGYFASRLNNALVTCESTLEKHACTLFESYPELQSYKAQPYGVQLYFLEKFRTVYPDFELVLDDGLALVDIRYIDNIHSPKFKARHWALKQYAEQHGTRYTLLTDKEILTPRRENARILLSLCNGKPYTRLVFEVKKWLAETLPIRFDQLLELTHAYPSVRAVVSGFILDGAILIDWEKPIQLQTLYLASHMRNG